MMPSASLLRTCRLIRSYQKGRFAMEGTPYQRKIPSRKWMRPWAKPLLAYFLLLCSLLCPVRAAQNCDEAGIDPQGNVYVASDEGKRIKVTETKRCEMVLFALNRQTVGCLVMRGVEPEEFSHPLKLEIYSRGGRQMTIE